MQEHPLDQARRWLEQARADLVLFLCQQSAEKALKRLLIWIRGDFARTHVITALLAELRSADPAVADELRGAAALDAYYQSTRYPDALGGAVPATTFQLEEATLAIGRAKHVLDIVGRELAERT
ncbi:MAG: HEPN domain-containing protein [Vulcanimicrobiaceae bacterium]